MGFAPSLLSCLNSIKAKDGFHREVIFQDTLKAGDCKCTPRESYVNAFHCIKTETIQGAKVITTEGDARLMLKLKENDTDIMHTEYGDFPIAHTYDDVAYSMSFFFLFFLLIIPLTIFVAM